MPPHLLLIRHADSGSNIHHPNTHDPHLTPLGEQQCAQLCAQLGSCLDPSKTLLVSSPLTRALQTATQTFPSLLPALALPTLQEISSRPCDTGRPLTALQSSFPSPQVVNFDLVRPGWESKTHLNKPCPRACSRRARSAWSWLLSRPEEWIVVIGHEGLFRYLTGDWEDLLVGSGGELRGWACGEWREFGFVGEGSEAELLETGQSRRARGARGARLGVEEQEVLRGRTEEMWRGMLLKQGFGVEEEWERERERRVSGAGSEVEVGVGVGTEVVGGGGGGRGSVGVGEPVDGVEKVGAAAEVKAMPLNKA